MSLGGLMLLGQLVANVGSNAANVKMNEKNNQLQYKMFKEANDFNATQAQINRDFQEQMSNTQISRTLADAKASGINPIFALGNTNSSPQGSTAVSTSTPNTSASKVQSLDFGSLINGALALDDLKHSNSQRKVNNRAINANTEKVKAEAFKIRNEAKLLNSSKLMTSASKANDKEEILKKFISLI